MSVASSHLALQHDRCNGCAKCVSVCPLGAIRVSGSHVHVDWRVCDQCCACVDVCEPCAIQRTVVPRRSAGTDSVASGDVSKVVVGSRAEAKAVRKRAEEAAKRTTKTSKPAVVPRASRQRAAAAAAAGTATGTVVGLGRAVKVPARVERPAEQADIRQPVGAAPPFGAVRWTLVDSALVLVLLLLSTVGKSVVLAIPAIALMPTAGQAMARAGILAVYYTVQLGAFALLAGRHGAALGVAFGLWRDEADDRAAETNRPSAIGSGALVAVLLVAVEAVAIVYGLAMQALEWSGPVTLSSDVSSAFGGGEVGLILAGVLVAIAAPFVEELAFRGIILAAVGSRWGMWPAIAISSVLFAVYHASVWLFFPMLVLGAALGWVAWTRRSLWPAIALHVLYNALAVTAAFLVPR
jgi:membrane protease YdiL (CAAX protease family)/Pyruvate/2-oxoacid:ferredoxin oxidoreductase delta subunit